MNNTYPMNPEHTILLVEDDKALSKILAYELTKSGFRVVQAWNGEEALLKLKTEKPDLVLLDLMLPVMDGYDVLQTMKASATWKHIPVIILSNLGQDSDIKQALALGAEDYFVKANIALFTLPEKIRPYLKKSV